MEEISDTQFLEEMRTLWQNGSVEIRNQLGSIIRDYFDEGDRAENIIFKLQS